MSDNKEGSVLSGSVQAVLAILRLVGKFAPSVFSGIAALIAEIEAQPTPTTEFVHTAAARHGIDLAEVAAYVEGHFVHK